MEVSKPVATQKYDIEFENIHFSKHPILFGTIQLLEQIKSKLNHILFCFFEFCDWNLDDRPNNL